MLKKLVNSILNGSITTATTTAKTTTTSSSSSNSKSNNKRGIKIKSVLVDGSYDSNTNFQYLQEKKDQPCIKVRKNSVSPKNNRLRNKEVMIQTKDVLKLKKKRKYKHICMAETAFLTIKENVWRAYICHPIL